MKQINLIGNWQQKIDLLAIWSKIMAGGGIFLQKLKWYERGNFCAKTLDFRYKRKNNRKKVFYQILVFELAFDLPLEVICKSVCMGNCGYYVSVCFCAYVYGKEFVHCVCRCVCVWLYVFL